VEQSDIREVNAHFKKDGHKVVGSALVTDLLGGEDDSENPDPANYQIIDTTARSLAHLDLYIDEH